MRMTTATLEKRVRTLEAEVKSLKSVMRESVRADLRAKIIEGLNSGPAVKIDGGYWKKTEKQIKTKAKKLPRWLQASLKDVEEGRVSGPFDTVDELMAHLQKK